MSKIEKKWYVLKTISGQEKKVKLYIENEVHRLGLNEYLGQILVPMEKVIQVRNGKKIAKEKVYFPGYVYMEVTLEGEMHHVIVNLSNVIGFLSEVKGGDPLPMRKSEVNKLLGKIDELAENIDQISIPYIIGETVKVIGGPFNGFNGSVEEINEDKKKLKVSVLIFGRKTPMELNFSEVEKI